MGKTYGLGLGLRPGGLLRNEHGPRLHVYAHY